MDDETHYGFPIDLQVTIRFSTLQQVTNDVKVQFPYGTS